MNDDLDDLARLLTRRLHETAADIQPSPKLRHQVEQRQRGLGRQRRGARVASLAAAVAIVGATAWVLGPNPTPTSVMVGDGAPTGSRPHDEVRDAVARQQDENKAEAEAEANLQEEASALERRIRELERRLAELRAYEEQRMREGADRGYTATPRRFLFEEEADKFSILDVVDYEGGAVSIGLVDHSFPGVALVLHVIPGSYEPGDESVSPQPLPVRGRSGFFVDQPDGSVSIIWPESEVLVMELRATPADTATAPTGEDLAAIAEQIVEVDEARWEQFRRNHS